MGSQEEMTFLGSSDSVHRIGGMILGLIGFIPGTCAFTGGADIGGIIGGGNIGGQEGRGGKLGGGGRGGNAEACTISGVSGT